jgi:NADPH:quinone reductase-like Zn-dependent oxidoreductase
MVKAARFSRFGGPEVLEIVDLPDPHPGPGQVRIAVRAAGVNPSDWKKRKGLMESRGLSRSPRSRRRTASARTVTCAGSSCW